MRDSVALILIPQSLAYAEIAGVPGYVGLYAAALPPLAASIIASSPYLQTGPVAMSALLAFGILSSAAEPGTAEYIAFGCAPGPDDRRGAHSAWAPSRRGGCILHVAAGAPRFHIWSRDSDHVVTATHALGVTAGDGRLLFEAFDALVHPGDWHIGAIGLSVVVAVVVLFGRRISQLFPGILLAVIIGIVYSIATGYDGSIVGDIPAGFPPLSVDFPWERAGDLLVGAVVMALVGFAEPSAISRALAAQDRTTWNPNQEFISQGLANVASAVSGGIPVGGSFARSSVSKLAGGKTRWSGAVTGLTVLAFLPVAGVLSDLPRAVSARS